MLAHPFLWLAALNALLAIIVTTIIIRRMHMHSNDQRATIIENGLAILASVRAQLIKSTEEVKAAIAQDGVQSARLDAAVDAFAVLADSLAPIARTLDELNPDTPSVPGGGEAPAPAEPPAAQPPTDDAFVAVGAVRFSDAQTQTEESLAAAVAAWNEAHPDQQITS